MVTKYTVFSLFNELQKKGGRNFPKLLSFLIYLTRLTKNTCKILLHRSRNSNKNISSFAIMHTVPCFYVLLIIYCYIYFGLFANYYKLIIAKRQQYFTKHVKQESHFTFINIFRNYWTCINILKFLPNGEDIKI